MIRPNSETRGQRIMNVIILVCGLVLISGTAAVPIDGPESYFDDWIVSGLPFLVVGLAVVAVRAPKYIRGGKA